MIHFPSWILALHQYQFSVISDPERVAHSCRYCSHRDSPAGLLFMLGPTNLELFVMLSWPSNNGRGIWTSSSLYCCSPSIEFPNCSPRIFWQFKMLHLCWWWIVHRWSQMQLLPVHRFVCTLSRFIEMVGYHWLAFTRIGPRSWIVGQIFRYASSACSGSSKSYQSTIIGIQSMMDRDYRPRRKPGRQHQLTILSSQSFARQQ